MMTKKSTIADLQQEENKKHIEHIKELQDYIKRLERRESDQSMLICSKNDLLNYDQKKINQLEDQLIDLHYQYSVQANRNEALQYSLMAAYQSIRKFTRDDPQNIAACRSILKLDSELSIAS
jgi:GTPase involved in cell partitioning and DNA repair